MSDLSTLLADSCACGVYHLALEPYEIDRAAKAAGLAVYRMDIGHAHDKGDFMAHVAKALAFPAHFGKNLDALYDCLTDLDWVEPGGKAPAGYVLVFEKSKHFGQGHKHAFDDCVAVLAAAAEHWQGAGKPFWGFIHGAQGWSSGLPVWPASAA
jgi:RNAse (barnase) inhibitor barstar